MLCVSEGCHGEGSRCFISIYNKNENVLCASKKHPFVFINILIIIVIFLTFIEGMISVKQY